MKLYEKYLSEVSADITMNQAVTGTGIGAAVLLWRINTLVKNVFSREARRCSTIIQPKEKNLCMIRAKLTNLNLELKQLKSSISKCKDVKCKQKISEKIKDKTEQYHSKTDQLNKLMG